MNKSIENELGTIQITQTTVSQIVYKTVSECFGVVGLPKLNISHFIKGDFTSHGMEVKITGNTVSILIKIQVLYGARIVEIARNISDTLIYQVEHSTGLKVEKINIKVIGVKVVK